MHEIVADLKSGKLKAVPHRMEMLKLAASLSDLKTALTIIANLLDLPLIETKDGVPGEIWDGSICYEDWGDYWPNLHKNDPLVQVLIEKVPEGKVRTFKINEDRIIVVEHIAAHHEKEGSTPSHFRFLKARKVSF